MKTYSFLTIIATPSLAIGAVINQPDIAAPSASTRSPSSVFGIGLFKGNDSGPCYVPTIEMAINSAFVLNTRVNYCISTQGTPATCISRKVIEPHGNETASQAYDASHGGLDSKPYLCNVIGYQQDDCPRDEGLEAQYHQANDTWSWDHATRVRDDFPGKLWSVLSFRISCIP